MTIAASLPPEREMYRALTRRDSTYEGVFWVGVRTTGIVCRPSCPARKPNPENVTFFAQVRDALAAGFRPCRRCRPLSPPGAAPDWLAPLLDVVDEDPARRLTDADVAALSLDPSRVRRWFQRHHGMTFQAYLRSRRMGVALGQLNGGAAVTRTAFESGYESDSGFREAFTRLFGRPPAAARGQRPLLVDRLLTPVGPMLAVAGDEGLCLLEFADRPMLETQLKRIDRRFHRPIIPGSHPHLVKVAEELAAYFAGTLKRFTVPLMVGGTPFQEQVWNQLQRIPYGDTASYDDLARAIGRPGAQRAVGRANGDNRLAIVIPCHRVVRHDGALGGYGGGLWRKQRLLDHERASA